MQDEASFHLTDVGHNAVSSLGSQLISKSCCSMCVLTPPPRVCRLERHVDTSGSERIHCIRRGYRQVSQYSDVG